MRPAEFIRPKQTKTWPCEGRAMHWSVMWGENVPHFRSTQLSLSQVLHDAWAEQARARSQEGEASVFPMNGAMGQAWRMVGLVSPTPEPHNSACLRFYPDLLHRKGPSGCQILVIRLFCKSSVSYSGWFFHILVVFSVWPWEEVSVTYTYSATILDLSICVSSFLKHLESFCPFSCFVYHWVIGILSVLGKVIYEIIYIYV